MVTQEIGKWLIGLGLLLLITGGVLVLAGKIPWLGRLPGDLVIRNENMTCFLPLATSILLSLVLTLLLNLLARFLNK